MSMSNISEKEKEDLLVALVLPWESDHNLEAMENFDRERVQQVFPELLKAWDDFKAAKAKVNDAFYQAALRLREGQGSVRWPPKSPPRKAT